MMEYRHLEVARRSRVAVVTFNRPKKANALNARHIEERYPSRQWPPVPSHCSRRCCCLRRPLGPLPVGATVVGEGFWPARDWCTAAYW